MGSAWIFADWPRIPKWSEAGVISMWDGFSQAARARAATGTRVSARMGVSYFTGKERGHYTGGRRGR
jgi:hypothetical protein